jgi:Fe-S cluster biogenesis protein NfuA
MEPTTNDSDLKGQVQRVLALELGQALGMDGTTLEVVAVGNGVAQVRVGGVGCCPSSVMAILMGVEEAVRKHVPGVQYLEMVP